MSEIYFLLLKKVSLHANGIINFLHVSKFQRNIFSYLKIQVGGYLKYKIEYELRKIREKKKKLFHF
jgi:hypothetical protein